MFYITFPDACTALITHYPVMPRIPSISSSIARASPAATSAESEQGDLVSTDCVSPFNTGLTDFLCRPCLGPRASALRMPLGELGGAVYRRSQGCWSRLDFLFRRPRGHFRGRLSLSPSAVSSQSSNAWTRSRTEHPLRGALRTPQSLERAAPEDSPIPLRLWGGLEVSCRL